MLTDQDITKDQPAAAPTSSARSDHAPTRRPRARRRLFAVLVATVGLVGALASVGGTAHASPGGPDVVEFSVGYFYTTFDQSPNVGLLVGGSVEEFCEDAPDDPFNNAEPGSAQARVFERNSGRVDIHVNDKDQPIYLYEDADPLGPDWIEGACAAYFDGDPNTLVPTPIAVGTANLKVRIGIISPDLIDVFNSVNGIATGSDGTTYKVRASADLTVENGAPVGDPAEFVDLELVEIRR